MNTDYKFWYIKRDDEGFIVEAAVRYYEGEYQVVNGKEKYVRVKRLDNIVDLKHLAKKVKGKDYLRGITEENGKVCVYYTPEDFGQIKTDDEICLFLNRELAKDTKRSAIKGQDII